MNRMSQLLFLLSVLPAMLPSCVRAVPEKEIEIVHVVDTLYLDVDYPAGRIVSIQEFGVLPTNMAAENKRALQAAIDEASVSGLALYVTPVENGYPMEGGLDLKKNVALIGAHGPTGRGTVNAAKTGPTGSLFVITDRAQAFLTVHSATRVEGLQFYYPEQSWQDPSKVIAYPPTIQLSPSEGAQGVTLRDLTFYGEYFAMDFQCAGGCEQILFENCYGYPLSGRFIAVSKCWDIPRILHCHVNPANMREFGRGFSASMVDYVVGQQTYAYWIDRTDNAVVMDVFTYGSYGGIYLGENTYGQLTNFNFDCVTVGIYRLGNMSKNRTWLIAQGSVIANQGLDVAAVHPVVIGGSGGHTSLTNVECFSGMNGGHNCVGASYDFICLEGNGYYTVSMTGCRMSGYVADDPITVRNPYASLRASDCVDKDDRFFSRAIDAVDDFPSGTLTVFDACDALDGWSSGLGGSLTLDTQNQREGSACLSASGSSGVALFTKVFKEPVAAKVSARRGRLRLQLYVSDISALDLDKEGALEVTSGGACDKEEFAWYLKNLGLQSGWNQLDLKLSGAGITGGTPDLSRMNYIRIYSTGVRKSVTLKLDDIHFYQE